jgi:hypothetical protein
MKKRRHPLARISLIFGMIAVYLAFRPAPGPKLIAVPLGFMALCFGVAGYFVIRRSRGVAQGAAAAALGAALGVAGVFLTIVMLSGNVAYDRDRWRQQQAAHIQRIVSRGSVPNQPATNFSSNLPIIVLQTGARSISKENETTTQARFFDTANGRASSERTPDYQGPVGIHLRGSSTLQLPKQSYTMHTFDRQGKQTKVSLLGLPKEEDWVLYAPFEDKTMIRDVLAFELMRKMGHYAPRTRYVELFMKRADGLLSMRDYCGVYVLMEKIKRGSERVNIAKLGPDKRTEPEISGGYIVKRDHWERGESRFQTTHGGPYFFVYPNSRDITSQQKSWLTRYFNAFESALYGPDFADPKTGYAAYLDVDAFIDAHWLVEMSKNVDGFRYSAFLYKDRNGKINAGPPWDWNRSFGNANYYGGGQTHGWYWSRLRANEISWYQRLREDPEFARRAAARWNELRRNIFDPKKISALIDQYAAQLHEAQQRNFERWPIIGEQITCNFYVGHSYDDEVRWLKKWITDRINWIDKQVDTPAESDPQSSRQ